jgi:hypothetical protein
VDDVTILIRGSGRNELTDVETVPEVFGLFLDLGFGRLGALQTPEQKERTGRGGGGGVKG